MLFLVPLIMAIIYSVSNFRIAMDILALVFLLNLIAFLIHSALNNWNRPPPLENNIGN